MFQRPPKLPLVTRGAQTGIVETFPEIGLPRVTQTLTVAGHETTLQFVQEPEKYPGSTEFSGSSQSKTFGNYAGTLWQEGEQICFAFPSGQSISGSAIIASICAIGGGYSVDDLQQLVTALSFGANRGQ